MCFFYNFIRFSKYYTLFLQPKCDKRGIFVRKYDLILLIHV